MIYDQLRKTLDLGFYYATARASQKGTILVETYPKDGDAANKEPAHRELIGLARRYGQADHRA